MGDSTISCQTENTGVNKPELEVFSVPVNLDCQGQRLTRNYFVKSDLSVVQWAIKTTEYHTPPDDYQPRCFNIGPTPVQALIPDLHGYFVNYNGTDVLLTANGTKWLPAFFNLEGDDPSEILRSSTMVSDANQNIASMSAVNPTLKSSALNPAKNVRVNYFYSLTQFKNRLRTKDITYFSGTLLTIAADGTVWGMGDDSYGQASGSGVPYQGQYKEVTEPQQIPGPVDIVEVYGAGSYVTALSSTGDVWLWGSTPKCANEYDGLAPRILTNIN